MNGLLNRMRAKRFCHRCKSIIILLLSVEKEASGHGNQLSWTRIVLEFCPHELQKAWISSLFAHTTPIATTLNLPPRSNLQWPIPINSPHYKVVIYVINLGSALFHTPSDDD